MGIRWLKISFLVFIFSAYAADTQVKEEGAGHVAKEAKLPSAPPELLSQIKANQAEHQQEADLAILQADLEMMKLDMPAAEKTYQDAIRKYHLILYPQIYSGLANVQFTQGKLDEAKTNFEEALLYRETLNDPRDLANIYAGLGQVLLEKKDYPGAIEDLSGALDIYNHNPVNSDYRVAETLYSLARAQKETGKKDEAIRDATKALRAFKQIDDAEMRSRKVKEAQTFLEELRK